MAILNKIRDEILNLIYKEPKCDFEHAWNCAISEASDCFNGYIDDGEISINPHILKPEYEIKERLEKK